MTMMQVFESMNEFLNPWGEFLWGIAWQAGGVILLDRAAMIAEAERSGLFLWACAP